MHIQSLASFILSQTNEDGAVGELARCAAKDTSFPREGDLKAISLALNRRGAPPEFHDALDEAQADWRNHQ